ncbi:hypothetical protein KAI58_00290 [Candidatus Gracilibacteria bacterium]|nr:hypothetical protein [Candidatus Gracilibacteria bacterium]
MSIKAFEEYLERRGAKYFVTFLMFCYFLGIIIFNVYLRSLGIYDFEFLQLRYMFSGAIFVGFTAAFWGVFMAIRIFFGIKQKVEKEEEKKISKRYELLFLVFTIFWLPIYALYIFPIIPANFGGAKPILARFVGNYESIEDINEIIEFETGAENLPLQSLGKDSKLAVGANVKILDRNANRIWIILTKDLYWRSKSNLAKNLLDSGEDIERLKIEDSFKEKPLFVEAKAIKSISFSLYTPSDIFTNEDLAVAAEVLATSTSDETRTKSSEIIKKAIEIEVPGKSEEIFAAVEKLATPTSSKLVQAEQLSQIKKILETNLNVEFLEFRADVFGESLRLMDIEKFKGIQRDKRMELAEKIQKTLETAFGLVLPVSNFLIVEQKEPDFLRKILQICQGTKNPEEVMERILAQTKEGLGGEGFSGSGSVQELEEPKTSEIKTNE